MCFLQELDPVSYTHLARAKAHRTGGGSTGTQAGEKGQPPSLSAPDRCGGAGRRWNWLLCQDLQAEA